MDEEDEDKLLLSSLGITSVKPEDIERKILSEVIPFLPLISAWTITYNHFCIILGGLLFSPSSVIFCLCSSNMIQKLNHLKKDNIEFPCLM